MSNNFTLIEIPDSFMEGYLLSRFLGWQQRGGGVKGFNIGYGFVLGDRRASDGSGGGLNGENGKPLANDPLGYLGESAISGRGASQSVGGYGLFIGSFGRGGGQYTVQPSCGGGGGWFGGGSSFLGSGGGGGSGYVLTAESARPEGYEAPEELEATSWTLVPGVNYREGFCLITSVETSIFWEFEYTGNVQKFVIPFSGFYRIDCFGAEGGGSYPNDEDIKSQQSGGMGGYSGGTFYFLAGMTFYIYVGNQGNRDQQIDAWNGGASGKGSCYGGGGATDVRWSGVEGAVLWNQNLYDRFIVAGGGGGQGMDEGHTPPPTRGNDPPGPPRKEREREEKERQASIPPFRYLLNDLSLIHIDFASEASEDRPEGEILPLQLYVNNTLRATLNNPLAPGFSSQRYTFDASDFIPPNSEPYLYELKIVFLYPTEGSIVSIIPGSISITIEQRLRPNDIIPDGSENQGVIPYDFVMTLSDIYTLIDSVDVRISGKPDTEKDINLGDIYILEDVTSTKVFNMLRINVGDTYSLEDMSRVNILTHYKVNVQEELVYQDSVVVYYEGEEPAPPDEDLSFLDTYVLESDVIIDLRGKKRERLDDDYSTEDKVNITISNKKRVSLEDELYYQDDVTINFI